MTPCRRLPSESSSRLPPCEAAGTPAEKRRLRGIGILRERVIKGLESLVEFVASHIEIGEREPGGRGGSLLGLRAQQSLLFFGVAGPLHPRGERRAEDAVPALLQSLLEDLDCALRPGRSSHNNSRPLVRRSAPRGTARGTPGTGLRRPRAPPSRARRGRARRTTSRERRFHLLARVVELLTRVLDRILRLVDLVRRDQRRHAGNQNGDVVRVEFEYPLDVGERVLVATWSPGRPGCEERARECSRARVRASRR